MISPIPIVGASLIFKTRSKLPTQNSEEPKSSFERLNNIDKFLLGLIMIN
jgi:hypothetical protein